MGWQALKIRSGDAQAEALSDALLELGALSAGIEDAFAGTEQEQPLFGEPGEPAAGVWQTSIVSALFPSEADVPALAHEAAHRAGMGETPPFSVETVEDQDWVRLTQSQFEPIKISERLWIVPTWHHAPDPDTVNLILDPGLAFGTGSHPTTRLCLQWLDAHIKGEETVLDYGCGSGILAIAAKKFGAGRVVGVDIDPQAIVASKANAIQNSVQAEFFLADEAPSGVLADILVANILTNPLKVLAPALAARVKPGGTIVLSGILEPQAQDVITVYGEWFDMTLDGLDEGWVRLRGIKKTP
jgi:ribosomal protein L11 methyltransferase